MTPVTGENHQTHAGNSGSLFLFLFTRLTDANLLAADTKNHVIAERQSANASTKTKVPLPLIGNENKTSSEVFI